MIFLGTELEDFINPPKIGWYDAEIKHLMNNADRNRDFVLSKVFQNFILSFPFERSNAENLHYLKIFTW